MEFNLPPHFLGDLTASAAFGLLAIALVILGFKVFDWLTPKIDLETELAEKQNIALAIVTSAMILGICYVVAQVITRIIGA